MREIELKFDIAAADAGKLARSSLLRGVRPRRSRLRAIYFDTPDHRLAAHGMALRVRREGGRWVQCLKAGRSGEAGLHSRDEWEAARPDATLDLALLRGTPLAAVLRGAKGKLAPVFEVDMRRTAWDLPLGAGDRVEVALDRGEVRHGRKRSPICEVEIESREGDPGAVFDAAQRLLRELPLRASAVSKAQRGYSLTRRAPAGPVKAVRAELDPDASVASAARRIVSAALAQMQGNEARAADPRAEEYLHQFRVGLRRLRSALRVFRDAFTRAEASRIRADCQWLARVTGPARDWDVLAQGALATVRQACGSAAEKRELAACAARERGAARERLGEALASPRYARFLLRLGRWLARPAAAMKPDLRAIAGGALERQHRKSRHALRGVASMGAAKRHRVRIRLKRLRYACEALAPVFGSDHGDPYIRALERLQDDLGGAADARVAMRLVKPLGLRGEAARRAWARLREIEARCLRDVDANVAAFGARPPFWRDRG